MGCNCYSLSENQIEKRKKKKELQIQNKENEIINHQVCYSELQQAFYKKLKNEYAKNDETIRNLLREDLNEIYIFEKLIYLDTNCKIFQAKKDNFPLKYQIKSCTTEDLNNESLTQLKFELESLKNTSQSNLINVYEYYLDSKYFHVITQTENDSHKDLLQILLERGVFTEEETCNIISKLLSAMDEFHSKGIIHRNIIPENIKFHNKEMNFNPLLTNFCFKNNHIKRIMSKNRIESSLFFAAPELYYSECSTKSDIWSIGILMYILLSAELPFYSEKSVELEEFIKNRKLNFSEKLWTNITGEAKHLITKMICKNPDNRPSAKECLNNWFFDKHIIRLHSMNSNEEISNNIIFELNSFSIMSRYINRIIALAVEYMSNQQIDRLNKHIIEIDKHKTGLINYSDLQEAIKLIDNNVVQAKFKLLMKEFANPDFKLRYKDIFEGFYYCKKEISEELLWNLFKFIDTDNDKLLYYNEFKTFLDKISVIIDVKDISLILERKNHLYEKIDNKNFQLLLSEIKNNSI